MKTRFREGFKERRYRRDLAVYKETRPFSRTSRAVPRADFDKRAHCRQLSTRITTLRSRRAINNEKLDDDNLSGEASLYCRIIRKCRAAFLRRFFIARYETIEIRLRRDDCLVTFAIVHRQVRRVVQSSEFSESRDLPSATRRENTRSVYLSVAHASVAIMARLCNALNRSYPVF